MSVKQRGSSPAHLVAVLMWSTNLLIVLGLMFWGLMAAGVEIRSPYFVMVFGTAKVSALGAQLELADQDQPNASSPEQTAGSASQAVGGNSDSEQTVIPLNTGSSSDGSSLLGSSFNSPLSNNPAEGGLSLGLGESDQVTIGLNQAGDPDLELETDLSVLGDIGEQLDAVVDQVDDTVDEVEETVDETVDDAAEIIEELIDQEDDPVNDLLGGLGLGGQ